MPRNEKSETDETTTGQVGWWCSSFGYGWYVLCMSCGHNRPSPHGRRSYSEPLFIDSIRPQPQTCTRCKSVIVEGLLPYLPSRYDR